MIPHNKLGKQMIKKLKVFGDRDCPAPAGNKGLTKW